jgi:ABC-2 type transport system ATP-binding protein
MKREPRLKVRGLEKSYGQTRVLAGLDLTVSPGEVVAITGANACGKSTLLRCLVGLTGCQGDVEVDGAPIATRMAEVGYLPQHVTFPRWATVGEVLDYFARLRGADPSRLALGDGFLPDAGQRVPTLSGGQRQRVAVAIAMLGNPALLLLDEPVASLDDSGVPALFDVIGNVAAAGGSVVVTTPRHDTPVTVLDRVLHLAGGTLEPSPPPSRPIARGPDALRPLSTLVTR